MTWENFSRKDFLQLTETQQNLLKNAEAAIVNSYAVYSNFEVGAALLLEDGTIVKGSNQENIAYPSGICAERSALFAYGSGDNKAKIVSLAVVARFKGSSSWATGAPCGACRQVMLEYERIQKVPYEVIFRYEEEYIVTNSAKSLLPFDFHVDELGSQD